MYLYSNIIGTFVFNQNFQIREKIIFTEKEIISNLPLFLEEKVLPSEEKFLKKFKKINNLRDSKISDNKSNSENKKYIEKVNLVLEEYKDEIYNANLLLTKSQIKDSVNFDQLIIQTIDSINEINRAINILVKRVREWYSHYLPEIEKRVDDHEKFIEIILNSSKKEILKDLERNSKSNNGNKFVYVPKEERKKGKENDSSKSNKIQSMGADLSKEDVNSILSLAKSVESLFKEKQNKEDYLKKLMKKHTPNLEAVAGYLIGAKLISIAGSLKKMVRMPASTIQILGAEKALFRHMRTGARPPRHGIIVNHPLISGKLQREHGKRARALADKISMAVKIDYFKGEFIGDKLKKELDKKFE